MVSATSSHIPVPGRQLSGLCRRYHVRRLALFGSVLRDDFRPDSDVDVLVAFDPKARIGFVTLSRMQRELSALFQRPVDLVPMDGLKPAIRESVLSSAQDVYAA
jgi:predicted nucleotidyltransferase